MTSWPTWLQRRRWPAAGSQAPRVLSPAEGYRRWARSYGHRPNAFQRLEVPALERLLPDVTGHCVLDLGCGKGRVSRLVLERGAARAIAADLSLAMLADPHACGGPKLVAAAGSPLPFRGASFDTVVCALVLGHVERLDTALAAIAETLRPGGCLVVSDFHPYATLRGWERTFVDAEQGEACAIVQHLHLFSDYVRDLGERGLRVEALEELEWQGSPVVFVLRARKSR